MRESIIVLCEAASAAFARAATSCRDSGYWTGEYQRALEFARDAQEMSDRSTGFNHPTFPNPTMEGNSKTREGVAKKLDKLAGDYGKIAKQARMSLGKEMAGV